MLSISSRTDGAPTTIDLEDLLVLEQVADL